MIYDGFHFFNELDILEIRLNTLKNVVDKFVLVEAENDHRNKPKPLWYAENKDRFAEFEDRIIHVVVGADKFTEDQNTNSTHRSATLDTRMTIPKGGLSTKDLKIVKMMISLF